jgi:hypothetical protein
MSAWKQTASKGGEGNFEKAPPGNHPAVLVGMIDMGIQESEFQGEKKDAHRVYFVWELPHEKKEDGNSHTIAIDLTLSLNEKAKLRKWIESRIGRQIADGEEYDVSSELGQACLLNVVQKDKYPKVEGMSALPKGMAAPVATITPFAWHLDQLKETGKIDLPAWVPYLFGEPLIEHIRRAKDIDAGSVQPAQAPAPAAAKPTAPNRPTPPSRPAAPNQTGTVNNDKYWLEFGDGSMTEAPLNHAEASRLIMSKGIPIARVQACIDGTTDWKPAEAVGLKIPF